MASATHLSPRRGPRPTLAACALLLLAAPPLAAQGRTVGPLTEAKTVGALQQCPPTGAPVLGAGPVLVRRAAAPAWSPVRIPATVMLQDRLRVQQTTDARLRIVPGARGGGVVYLAPSLVCHPRIAADTVVRGLRLRGSPWAEYEVYTDTFRVDGRRGERLAIAVQRGALIVQWDPGPPLLLLAVGDTAVIRGTTVAVTVDSTGNDGLLYLEEGSATLSRLPGGALAPGQLVRLRRGLAPVALGAELAAGVRESVLYHSRTLWSTPVPVARARRPLGRLALLGLGGVAAGVVLATTLGGGGDDAPAAEAHTGTVTLRLPH